MALEKVSFIPIPRGKPIGWNPGYHLRLFPWQLRHGSICRPASIRSRNGSFES